MKNLFKSDQNNRFNEILFENRNKNYGAYVLRNQEGEILQKSLLIGVALFAATALTPLLINSFSTKTVVTAPIPSSHTLKPVDQTPEKTPDIVKPIVPPKVNTYDSQIATPTKNANEPKPLTKQEIEDAVPGITTSLDNPPVSVVSPPQIEIPMVTTPAVVPPKTVDNNPVTTVDVEAKFNGGIDAFRNKVVGNFDTGNFEGSGDLMRTVVTFIVEKDGTISNIKANGDNPQFNKDAEKTIRSIKGKWTPAKLNGENVRSYFKFPISMQFE
ncbi:energy transducer TonB [Chryseobacterium manosquense]|uniref:Energy transducer TonB n=1 Tax=Chryseobacterium manosquense TaxID=2754694 RepID=A0A7H1DX84_9FLAO|nr:energy transducer TonB [Chryseobacterium manosquense]QNS41592.1 energy transducer TonB [Chryseobacterium manosquense]